VTELTLEALAALAAVAFVAGGIDAIAGGGGLLTVPALLLAGLDPVQAIATNKLQGSFGTASATLAFARARLFEGRAALKGAGLAAAGSVVGALCVSLVPRSWLEVVIPLLLLAMALYFATSRRMRNEDAHARWPVALVVATLVPAIGFYDGLFGPGAGSFYMLALVTLCGFGVVKATAHTKLLNFSSNVGSLIFFIAAGAVVWPAGLAMAGTSFLGAQLGSRLAIRMGGRLIRPLLVAICSAMALRLLLDPANPWRQALAGAF
jgi:uncharacterized protein